MGNLASYHGRPEVSFGAIVGGLHTVLAEEAQQAATVLLCARAVQQSLIIRIAQRAVPKQVRELVIQGSGLSAVVFALHSGAARRQPERASKQLCELTGEMAGAPVLLLRHLRRVADQVRQALLLRPVFQRQGIVTVRRASEKRCASRSTPPPVADHY